MHHSSRSAESTTNLFLTDEGGKTMSLILKRKNYVKS